MLALSDIIEANQDTPERLLNTFVNNEPTRAPSRASLDELDLKHHPMVATAVALARRWASERKEKPGLSLVLTGNYGIGKTHIARSIYSSFLLAAENVPEAYDIPAGRFYHAGDFLLALTPATDPTTKTIENIPVSNLIGIEPLVVLDDVGAKINIPYIGKEFQESERHNRFFRFFNYCSDKSHLVSVVITSNLSTRGGKQSPFAQHIGGRSWDRLVGMTKGYILDMGNVPSYRTVLANQ